MRTFEIIQLPRRSARGMGAPPMQVLRGARTHTGEAPVPPLPRVPHAGDARVRAAAIPLALLVAITVALRPALPAWAAMWAIAFAVFFGCKWLTWRAEAPAHVGGSLRHSVSYLFLWTGMDPAAFLRRVRRDEVSSRA